MSKDIHIATLAIAFAFLSAPFAAHAADGELWEVVATMNIPGMPAGMGGQKSRVCRAKNESPGAGRNDCKVSNLKRSGQTESMTVTCPDGTMTVEMTYNAARTEYKGTIKSGGRGEEMVMNTNGRRVGECDVAQTRNEQGAQAAKMQAEGNRMRAGAEQQEAEAKKQLAALEVQRQKADADQIRDCSVAVQTMDAGKLGIYGTCYRNKSEQCKILQQAGQWKQKIADACTPKIPEFCKRFQTVDGLRALWQRVDKKRDRKESKYRGPERTLGTLGNYGEYQERIFLSIYLEGSGGAHDMCDTQFKPWLAANCKAAGQAGALDLLSLVCTEEGERLAPQMCPRALEKEYLPYLGQFCQAEARPLAKKECAGRDYTALGGKYGEFCMLYMGQHGLEEAPGRKAARSGSTPAAQPAPAEKKKSAAESATDSVNQGINKLKGLFGR